MNYKKIAAFGLAAALSATAVTGCSKKNDVRKIEGANEQVTNFIGVTEKVYSMKGITTEIKTDIDSSAKLGEESQSVKGSLNTKSVLDTDGNLAVSVELDATAGDKTLKGKVAEISYIGNNLYLDLTGAYDVLMGTMGDKASQMLTMLNLTEEDLKGVLCLSIPTGDLKSSDFSLDAIKDILQPLTDDYAIALSAVDDLTVDGKNYNLNVSADSTETILKKFADAFEKNGATIIDNTVKYLEDKKIADKIPSAANAIVDEVYKAMGDLAGQDMSSAKPDMSKAGETVKKAIEELKTNKDKYVADVVKTLKNPEAALTEAESLGGSSVKIDQNVSMDVKITDEDNGFSGTFDAKGLNGSTDSQSVSASANGTFKVTSGADKISAPSNAKTISEAFAKIYPIITMLSKAFGSGLSL